MFELEQERVHAPEPDLVPILDGLTAVIFFLLLSVSFVGLTKVTLPPSSSSVSTSSNENPVSAKLRVLSQGSTVLIRLEWLGEEPGSLKENVLRGRPNEKNKALLAAVREMTEKFKKRFPKEKTLQLALAENMTYQEMISIMDGALVNIQDIALSSYTEAVNSDEVGE
jgi:biopolymer transport protein ExbD